MGAMGTFEHMSTHIAGVAPREFEPEQLHDARRPRVDVQHTTRTRGARLRVQHETEPAKAASMITLLVILSSALR